MQRENNSNKLMLIKIATYTYLGAAFVYVMYSLYTQTGLCGYLMDAQFRWYGVANEKITGLMAALILGAPVGWVRKYIKRKEAEAAGAINDAAPVNARSQQLTWKSLLIICAIPTWIALPAAYVLTRMDQKDLQREIYKVDLSSESALPSDDVKFVKLTGLVQLDYQYQLKTNRGSGSRNERTNTYAPLTGSGWTKKQPIKFFISTTFTSYFNPDLGRSTNFPEQGVVAATFDGQLSRNDLPTFVENEYERAGLRIESPYFVLDRMSFPNGLIPSAAKRDKYHLIPILGVGLSMMILFSGGLALAIRKLMRAG
jgi:hypothetical protein